MKRTRDRGITIVELTVTIALIGVLSTALLAGIGVVLRSERPTMSRLGESRDQQQLTNYFTQDVQSARPSAIDVTSPGGGCGSGGSSILTLTSDDGTLISYRLAALPDGSVLSRVVCTGSTVASTGIGKDLAADGALAMAGTPSGGGTRVTMRLTERSGRVIELSAVARNTMTTLPPPPPVRIGNPVDVAGIDQRFMLLVEQGGTLSQHVLGAVAVGGDLRFVNGPTVAGNTNTFTLPAESKPTGLLVGGRILWQQSSGSLKVDGGFAHIGDMLDTWVVRDGANSASGCVGNAQLIHILPAVAQTTCNLGHEPQIKVQNADQSDQVHHPVGRANAFPFAAAFAAYRATSAALATATFQTCAASMAAQVWDQNATSYWQQPGTNATLRLIAGKINTLAFTVATIGAIPNMNPGVGAPSAANPLIINVADSGAVTFNAPSWGAIQNAPKYVLWNFPNATSLTINGTVHGTVLAPDAAVSGNNATVTGNLIAKSLPTGGVTVKTDRFEGDLGCYR